MCQALQLKVSKIEKFALLLWSTVNYVERGLNTYRDYAVGMGGQNSHVRFYDLTSWRYVNEDDPIYINT